MISAVAFATILAVVAGLTLASSASFAHDIYANVIRRGRAGEREEISSAKLAAVAIGALAILLSIFADRLNVAAWSRWPSRWRPRPTCPTLLYSLFWKRFNTVGAVSSVYAGLISSVLLVIFSSVVSGTPTSLFPHSDFHWFPLENPGLVSIPIGFLAGWLGTLLSKQSADPAKYAELEVRSLTGLGAH